MIKIQITEDGSGIELEYKTIFDAGLAMTTLATVLIGSKSLHSACETLAPGLRKEQQKREAANAEVD